MQNKKLTQQEKAEKVRDYIHELLMANRPMQEFSFKSIKNNVGFTKKEMNEAIDLLKKEDILLERYARVLIYVTNDTLGKEKISEFENSYGIPHWANEGAITFLCTYFAAVIFYVLYAVMPSFKAVIDSQGSATTIAIYIITFLIIYTVAHYLLRYSHKWNKYQIILAILWIFIVGSLISLAFYTPSTFNIVATILTLLISTYPLLRDRITKIIKKEN